MFFVEPADEYQPVDDSNYFHQYNTEFNPEYSEVNEDHDDGNDNDNNLMENEEEHYHNEEDDYKYPGEPKKPNPPAKPDVNVHYDPSPDFNPPPRELQPKNPKIAQDNYLENHRPDYENQPLNDPEEYLGYENVPYPTRNHVQELRETKKGTREFLKHNTLPPNHELEDLRSVQRQQPVRVSCATRIKAKKPRTYIAYKVRPIYPRYRVVPLKSNRLVYFVKRSAPAKRRLYRQQPKATSDDSAYLINSAFDDDYQRVIKTV